MRQRQSSVTTDTQYPVTSIGATSRADAGGAAWPRPRPRWPANGAGKRKLATPRTAAAHTALFMDGSLLRPAQVLIDRLDEHGGRPRSAGCAVAEVVVERWPGGLHLLERQPLLDQIADPVAHDDQHVAVLDDIGL